MATRFASTVTFRYESDDHLLGEPHFEGVFEVEFSCVYDGGDRYCVDIEDITLEEGLLWFGDEATRIVSTSKTDKLAVEWFEKALARSKELSSRLNQACITEFENKVDWLS